MAAVCLDSKKMEMANKVLSEADRSGDTVADVVDRLYPHFSSSLRLSLMCLCSSAFLAKTQFKD